VKTTDSEQLAGIKSVMEKQENSVSCLAPFLAHWRWSEWPDAARRNGTELCNPESVLSLDDLVVSNYI